MTGPSLLESAVALGAAFAMNAARRAALAFAGYLAAAVLLATSVAFLTFSAYRAVAGTIGDVYAALLMGTAYLIAALIALLVVSFRSR